MAIIHLFLAALVIAAQLCAGDAVLHRVHGAAKAIPFRLACCYCTGAAVLCIQMLLVGACFGEYSFLGTVLPWLAVGGIRGWRTFSLERVQWSGRALAFLLGAVLFVIGAFHIAAPATTGDPASNFSAFGRLYAYLGQVAPSAGQQLSIYGHFEYPPLIAANESLFFMIDDAAGATLLMLMFAVYGLVLIALAGEILLRGATGERRVIGYLLLCLLVVQPSTMQLTTRGYADLPLVCAFLWMIFEVQRQVWPDGEEARSVWGVVIAGVVLALTKNEGIVLASAVSLFIPIAKGWRTVWVPVTVIGLASLWPLFIMQSGLQSVWVEGASEEFAMGNFKRLPWILLEMADRLLLFDRNPRWGISSFVLGVTVVVLRSWLRGVEFVRQRIVLVAFALHMALYIGIFIATSLDYQWHIKTAATRLVFHLVPYFVILAGMCLNKARGTNKAELKETCDATSAHMREGR